MPGRDLSAELFGATAAKPGGRDLSAYLATPSPAPESDDAAQARAYIENARKARGDAAFKAGQAAVNDLVGGAAIGVSDIGNTALNAATYLPGKLIPELAQWNRTRNADFDAITEQNKDSAAFKGARTAGNVVATLPVGGLTRAGVQAAAPLLVRAGMSAPAVEALATAAETGGFRTGAPAAATLQGKAADLATRAAGGALTGGTAAGLVDPGRAAGGALVGAALPGAFNLAGAAAGAIGSGYRSLTTSQESQLANKLAEIMGAPRDELISALSQQGPSMIPGFRPTVPQIVQSPELSQLQRTLHTAGATPLIDAGREQQAAFRAALDGIAPADISLRDAGNRTGSAIQQAARPAYGAATDRVSQAFDNVDPFGQSRLHLPVDEMQGALERFLGPGTFGTGSRAREALDTAESLGQFPATVNFRTLQNLRSSMGEAAAQAEAKGANKEAAALKAMVGEIDSRVNRGAGGSAGPREFFPVDMGDRYRDARALHADKINQFETGPQVGLFRMGGDGQAAIQGAEIPPKFYNGNLSQVEDMQAFKRLIGDNPGLLDEMKRYAMTEAQSTTNLQGDLTSKFNDWMRSRSGANRELLSPGEMATLGEVGNAVEQSTRAESLGRVSGPDTAQKIEAIKNLGTLDNKVVSILANKIPLVGRFTGPMLDGLRTNAAVTRNNMLAGLLADPEKLAGALQQPGPQKNAIIEMITGALPAVYRAAPVLATQ